MRNKSVKINLLTLLIIFCAGFIINQAQAESVVVLHVDGPDNGFDNLQLQTRINYILSGLNDFSVPLPEDVEYWLTQADRKTKILYSSDIQRELADKFGATYLLCVKIKKAGTKIKSSTLIPFLFKSHKRKFVYETEMRIIDSRVGKIIFSKNINRSKNGNRALAYLDLDAHNEPAMASTYVQEMEAFQELEDEVATKIVKELIKVNKKRK